MCGKAPYRRGEGQRSFVLDHDCLEYQLRITCEPVERVEDGFFYPGRLRGGTGLARVCPPLLTKLEFILPVALTGLIRLAHCLFAMTGIMNRIETNYLNDSEDLVSTLRMSLSDQQVERASSYTDTVVDGEG